MVPKFLKLQYINMKHLHYKDMGIVSKYWTQNALFKYHVRIVR